MLTSTHYRDRSPAGEEAIRSAFEFENSAAPYMITEEHHG